MTFSDTVKRVIDLTAAINDYWDEELPKRHPNYPLVEEGVDDGPPPPEEKELSDLLHALPPADVYRLAALMYLGRDRRPGTEWEAKAIKVADEWPNIQSLVRVMKGKGSLGYYLAEGRDALAAHGIDMDEAVGITP